MSGSNNPASLSPSEANRLACLVAQGDRTAFNTLVRECGPFVLARAMRTVRSREAAEEVTQVVFANLWTKATTFESGRGNLFAWLQILTRNASIDLLRVEGRHIRNTDVVRRQVTGEVSGPSEELERGERRDVVRHALSQLGEDQRVAIELAYFEGLTYVEVAERLGEAEGTVKSRIRRGMKQLARLVGENDDI